MDGKLIGMSGSRLSREGSKSDMLVENASGEQDCKSTILTALTRGGGNVGLQTLGNSM
jgi:hypothetical protein